MTYQIKQSDFDVLGYDLAEAVTRFQQALAAHATTVNVPAPVADTLVEIIARHHDGKYEVIPD